MKKKLARSSRLEVRALGQHLSICKKLKYAKNLNSMPRNKDRSNQRRNKQRKRTMKVATWNIQGLNTKQNEVFRELDNMKIDICVLTETKKKGRGNEMINPYIHFYSGVNKNERAKRGVSIAIHRRLKPNIRSWEEINERIITMELDIKGHEIVIIGVYAPTDDSVILLKDEFYAKLTTVLLDINPRKEVILLGDLNGKTGSRNDSKVVGRYGEEIENDSGQRLIELCESLDLKIMNGFFPHKWIHKYTWHRAAGHLSSVIDYVILRQKSKIRVTDVRAFRGPECGTDHFMVKAELFFEYRARTKQTESNIERNVKETVRYNIESLREDSIRFLYQIRLANKIQAFQEQNAEEMYEQVKRNIHSAAKEALGEKDTRGRKQPEWWTKELEVIVRQKKVLYETWLRTHDAEDRKAYARANRDAKNEVIKEKNKMWENKCDEIDRKMGGTKISEAWNTIKNLKRDTKNTCNIALISMKEWEEYYRSLLTEDRDTFKWKDKNENWNATVQVKVITTQEIRKALNTMKNGKAPGPGDIPIELVKYGPSILLERLAEIFNKCMLEGCEIPMDWNVAYLSSIHKKGSKKECGNYRGISVTSSVGRLYGKILKNRVEQEFTDIEEQSGFRAGRSCSDNIFIVRQLIEKRVARNLSTHLIFVDLEKAYDSVPLSRLFKVLRESRVNDIYVRSIYHLYKDAYSVVKQGREISKRIKISKGLKQGCCLSPTLFKIYTQEALKQWSRKCSKMGIQVGDTCLYNLLFADDQILIANDEYDVSFMVRKLLEEYSKWGLKVNLNKTEYLCVGENGNDIELGNETIKACEEYRYLGSIVSKEGTCEKDIKSKTVNGRIVLQKLNSLLWSSKMKINTKINIYKSIVLPITTYSSECWQVSDRNRQKLEAVEMDFLRRACRISRLEHVRNEEIRNRTNMTETISDKIEEQKLRWYGHVMRMGNERWPRRIAEYSPLRRRKRGRPRRTWKQEIEDAMRKRDLQDNDWQDRRMWKLRCGMRQQP